MSQAKKRNVPTIVVHRATLSRLIKQLGQIHAELTHKYGWMACACDLAEAIREVANIILPNWKANEVPHE